jgi:hypothetical protein
MPNSIGEYEESIRAEQWKWLPSGAIRRSASQERSVKPDYPPSWKLWRREERWSGAIHLPVEKVRIIFDGEE